MRPRERVTSIAALATVAVAVFAVGGALRGAQAAIALLAVAAIAPSLLSRSAPDRVSPLVAVLGVAGLLTVIQLIPLPEPVLSFLDPVGQALRDDGATLLDVSTWPCLTRDPAGTIRGVVYFAVLLAIASVALRMSVSERGRYRVLAAVGAIIAAVAVVVGLHQLFGARSLYGFYDLQHARPYVIGPLLNENHLGGLMAIGTAVSAGLAIYARQPTWLRVAWLASAAACGATAVATSSRGATLAMIAGLFTMGCVVVAQRFVGTSAQGRQARLMTRSLPIVVVAVCAVVVAIYSSAGRVQQQLSSTGVRELDNPTNKFAAWKGAEELVRESPWTGVGRGGFEPSFTRVYAASGLVTFSHVENEYLQAVVDWGIPGALALGLCCVWIAVVAVRRWRNGPLAAAAIGALVVGAVQAVVDFGLELPGLGLPIVAVAATMTYVPIQEASERARRNWRVLRLGHCVLLVLGAVLLLAPTTKTLDEDHQAIAHTANLDEIRESLARHPHDYFGYATAARVMSQAGDKHSVDLLNHAMRLHPTHPGLHVWAARMLYRGDHKEQAAIEYQIALRATAEPRQLLSEIVGTFQLPLAVAALPLDPQRPEDFVTALVELHRADVAIAWLSKVRQLHPRNAHACDLLYKIALDHGDLQAAEAAGRRCVDLLPDRQTRLALARVLYNRHGYAEVIRLLQDVETWTGRIDEKVDAWFLRCDSEAQRSKPEDAIRCLRRLDASGLPANEQALRVSHRIDELVHPQPAP